MLVKFVTHTKVVLPIWSMYRSPWSCRLCFCFFWPTGSKAGDQLVYTKQSREYDSMTDIAKCTETPSEGAVGRFTIYNRKIVELSHADQNMTIVHFTITNNYAGSSFQILRLEYCSMFVTRSAWLVTWQSVASRFTWPDSKLFPSVQCRTRKVHEEESCWNFPLTSLFK